MDISDFSNPVQLVLHCAFSFWIKFSDGSFAYISYIVLTKDCCSLCSSSQSAANFFLIDFLFLNIYSSVTLLLVMAMLTSTIWTERFETLGSTIACFSIIFTLLFLNIFCISLYLRQSMILCPVLPQIWQEYLTCLYTLICWVISLEIAGVRSSFHLYRSQHYDLFCDNLYNTFLLSLGLFEVFELILSYSSMVFTYCL